MVTNKVMVMFCVNLCVIFEHGRKFQFCVRYLSTLKNVLLLSNCFFYLTVSFILSEISIPNEVELQ